MPGLSYSLPAWECKTGAKLAKIKGSVCNGCYAMKGNYTRYPAIKAAQYVRLKAITDPRWVDAMVAQIKNCVAKVYSAQNITESYIDEYDKICNSKAGSKKEYKLEP